MIVREYGDDGVEVFGIELRDPWQCSCLKLTVEIASKIFSDDGMALPIFCSQAYGLPEWRVQITVTENLPRQSCPLRLNRQDMTVVRCSLQLVERMLQIGDPASNRLKTLAGFSNEKFSLLKGAVEAEFINIMPYLGW